MIQKINPTKFFEKENIVLYFMQVKLLEYIIFKLLYFFSLFVKFREICIKNAISGNMSFF